MSARELMPDWRCRACGLAFSYRRRLHFSPRQARLLCATPVGRRLSREEEHYVGRHLIMSIDWRAMLGARRHIMISTSSEAILRELTLLDYMTPYRDLLRDDAICLYAGST